MRHKTRDLQGLSCKPMADGKETKEERIRIGISLCAHEISQMQEKQYILHLGFHF
jgi:hypothetical protein